ncbi:MAG: antA/AntB antirepressor family protein [Sphingopyxis sp.]|nr:antA/AntB antirepressor family protein [Sphingopyxis sp.]
MLAAIQNPSSSRERKENTPALPLQNTEGTPKVDARALHAWLGIGRRFPSWIAGIFTAYAFDEGADFIPVRGESTGGRPRKDYLLTLDVAKEIAMIGNTAKGRATRPQEKLLVRMFYLCSHMGMDNMDPARVAETILAAPGWARVGITAPNSNMRIEAAFELAKAIIEGAAVVDAPSPDQLGLSL